MYDLKKLKRVLPYPLRYVRAAALDMVGSVSEDATVCKEHWQLSGTVTVYGNESKIAVEIAPKDDSYSTLHIRMLEPSPKLSGDGQCRALAFLADGMEQLLENTLAQANKKERVI